MEFFFCCEKGLWLKVKWFKAINYFPKKSLPYMFDRVLNTPLGNTLREPETERISGNIRDIQPNQTSVMELFVKTVKSYSMKIVISSISEAWLASQYASTHSEYDCHAKKLSLLLMLKKKIKTQTPSRYPIRFKFMKTFIPAWAPIGKPKELAIQSAPTIRGLMVYWEELIIGKPASCKFFS